MMKMIFQVLVLTRITINNKNIMENTAKDFLISHYPTSRESDFTKEGKEYFTLYYTVDLMECYAKELQAKHDEELKQAVVDAIKTDVFPLMDEANFIAKNLKDNPYCTVYRLHELNKNIEGKYGIEIEYTPTGKL